MGDWTGSLWWSNVSRGLGGDTWGYIARSRLCESLSGLQEILYLCPVRIFNSGVAIANILIVDPTQRVRWACHINDHRYTVGPSTRPWWRRLSKISQDGW